MWTARRSAYGVFAKLAPDLLSEDVTVPVSRVPEMIRKSVEIAEKYGLQVGILAHAGDGNMHPMIPADRIMLLSSGLTFGYKRTLSHALGVNFGFPVMVLCVGLGVGKIFEIFPAVYTNF